MTERSPLVDRTIDDVARAMTSARRGDLGAAVLPRLAPRRPSELRWMVPAAVIATVVVVVALVTRRTSVSIQTADGGPVLRVASGPSSPGTHSAAPPAAPADGEAGRRTISTTAAVTGGDSTSSGIQTVPPLDAVSAIAVTSIQPVAARIPQLAVAPIDAAAPLAMPEIGRDR